MQIRFNNNLKVWRFEATKKDQSNIKRTFFNQNKVINERIKRELIAILNYMQPGDRPCQFVVALHPPITEQEAKRLTQKSDSRAKGTTGIVAALGCTAGQILAGKPGCAGGTALGTVAGEYISNSYRKWKIGDILIEFSAKINGGIGPQKRASAIVISRHHYDPNGFKL